MERGVTRWDVTPKGFEQIEALRLKISGLFNKVGTRKLRVDYSKVMAMLNGDTLVFSNGGLDLTSAEALGKELDLATSKVAKSVIISGCDTAKLDLVVQFINNFIITLDIEEHESKSNVITGQSVIEDRIIIEFINCEVATIALLLDGQSLPNEATILQTARPKSYVSWPSKEGLKDDENKLVLTNIPKEETRDDIVARIEKVAGTKCKHFKLLQNQITQQSCGIAFLKFDESTPLDEVIAKLNETFTCRKICSLALRQDHSINFNNISQLAMGKLSSAVEPSTAIQFWNCFSKTDNKDLIKIDFKDKCSTYGQLDQVLINGDCVVVSFKEKLGSVKLMSELNGVKYNNHTVLANFIDPLDLKLKMF